MSVKSAWKADLATAASPHDADGIMIGAACSDLVSETNAPVQSQQR
jgi:hypothetical protein